MPKVTLMDVLTKKTTAPVGTVVSNPPPIVSPSVPSVSQSSTSSSGGGTTQTKSSFIPSPVEQIFGKPIEEIKTEIALQEKTKEAPKVMTPQGSREWAIKKEVYAGNIPIGYGGVYSERKYTPQQLVQRSYDIYQQSVKNRSNIENVVGSIEGGQEYVPPEWFPHTPNTVSVTGYRLKEYLKENYVDPSLVSENQANKFYQESLAGVKEWHPDTKITETPTGFKFDFPYAGAEKYGSYKNSLESRVKLFEVVGESIGKKLGIPFGKEIGGVVSIVPTAFTPEDPLGIPSAYYQATGDTQKAIDAKIKALNRVSNMEDIRKSGDKLNFAKEAGLWYIESPAGMIGTTAITAGAIAAPIGAFKATSIGGRVLWSSKAVSSYGRPLISITPGAIAETAVGGYFVAKTGGEWWGLGAAGKTGELAGSIGMFGLTLYPGIKGYQAGSAYGRGKVESFNAMRGLSSVERTQFKSIMNANKAALNVNTPKLSDKIMDISRDVARVTKIKATQVVGFIRGENKKFFGGKPIIGGSSSTGYQMPEGTFRTGEIPESVFDYATKRQALSSTKSDRPLIGNEKPQDIDLLVRQRLGALDRAMEIKESHVVDVSAYRPEGYLGFGFRSLKPVKGKVVDPWLTDIDIRSFKDTEIPQMADAGGFTLSTPYERRGFEGWLKSERINKYLTNEKPMIFLHESIYETNKSGFSIVPEIPTKSMSYFGRIPTAQGKITILPIKRTYGTESILRHEIGHHRFPSATESMNELLESKLFRDPKIEQSIQSFLETDKWSYPGEVVPMKVLSLKEQFIRKGISILPGQKEFYYRSYKDVPDWWNIGTQLREYPGGKKVGKYMDIFSGETKVTESPIKTKIYDTIDRILPKKTESTLEKTGYEYPYKSGKDYGYAGYKTTSDIIGYSYSKQSNKIFPITYTTKTNIYKQSIPTIYTTPVKPSFVPSLPKEINYPKPPSPTYKPPNPPDNIYPKPPKTTKYPPPKTIEIVQPTPIEYTIPIPKMYGHGRRGWDYKLRQQEYKFRKASIKLPFSMAPRKVRF